MKARYLLLSMLTLLAPLAFAQQPGSPAEPADSVPVTALNLNPAVTWPSTSYRLLGTQCTKQKDGLLTKLKAAGDSLPGTLEKYECYTVSLPQGQTFYYLLQFVSGYTKQSGYSLTFEDALGPNQLVQSWRKKGKADELFYAYLFNSKGMDFFAALIAPKTNSSPKKTTSGTGG